MPVGARGRQTSTVRAGWRALLTVLMIMVAACTSPDEPQRRDPVPDRIPPPSPSSVVKLPPDTPALNSVIPKPVRVQQEQDGNFALAPGTAIEADAEATGPAGYLAEVLRRSTGFALPVTEPTGVTEAKIALRLAPGEGLSGEAYRLEVAPGGVTITAAEVGGLFAGVQTLRQLLPADIERSQPVRRAWAIPGGTITDRPRFAYRGAMLDVARHFFDADVVKRHIDRVAQYKINHLHLHLADDQGWRIEINGWPMLTTVGGRSQVGGGKGGFYTQDEYRDIVAHAASRGIVVVPEIDLPGHTNAALTAYPELNCSGNAPAPYTGTQVGFSSLCIGKPETYRFARAVIRDLAAMTPGQYLHIGGDEATSTKPADYRRFFGKVLPMVTAAGKRPLGWHEYAQAALPESAVVQYWQTENSNAPAARAAASGRQVLMSPANKTYLDMKYFDTDPWGNKWAGPVSVRTAYRWDPAAFLSGVGERSVLGVETPLWTELVETEREIERMAFPRIPAIAEVGWTGQQDRSWREFSRRLAAHAARMTAQGIAFHRSPDVPW